MPRWPARQRLEGHRGSMPEWLRRTRKAAGLTNRLTPRLAGHEFLDAHAASRFPRIDSAPGINSDLVQRLELAGVMAAMAKMGDFRAILAAQDAHGAVAVIGRYQELLARVAGKSQRHNRAHALGFGMDHEFGDEA